MLAALVWLVMVQEPAETEERTPLMIAALDGDVSEIERLLREGANPNARDGRGNTALLLGVAGGADVVRALLAGGTEPDLANDDGATPLIRAAQGDVEVVRLLLDAGADPSHRDELGVSPLAVAEEAGAAEIAALLRERGARESPEELLNEAVRSGDRETVERLIAEGADVDALDTASYQTPLMTALELGHLEILLALLDAGADPTVEGTGIETTGDNAIRMAARLGSPWALRQLLDATSRQRDRDEALLLGCENEIIVRVALESGAQADARDERARTALACAAASGSPQAVKRLLDAGADPEALSEGRTALGWAIANGHADVIRVLQGGSSSP